MRPSRPPVRHPPLHGRIGRKMPSLFPCTSPAMEGLLPFLVFPLQGGRRLAEGLFHPCLHFTRGGGLPKALFRPCLPFTRGGGLPKAFSPCLPFARGGGLPKAFSTLVFPLQGGGRLAEGESEGSFCRRTFLFCNRGVCAFLGNDPPIPGIRPPRRLFAEQKSGAYFHKRRPKNLCYSSFFSSVLPSSASFMARAFAILASCLACFFISLVTTRAASICACISCGVGGTNDAPSAFSGMTS